MCILDNYEISRRHYEGDQLVNQVKIPTKSLDEAMEKVEESLKLYKERSYKDAGDNAKLKIPTSTLGKRQASQKLEKKNSVKDQDVAVSDQKSTTDASVSPDNKRKTKAKAKEEEKVKAKANQEESKGDEDVRKSSRNIGKEKVCYDIDKILDEADR